MLDRGLRRRFDPLVEREARRGGARRGAATCRASDLRDLPTFTIDPPTARDFDDAISAERLDGGRDARLGPHRRRRRARAARLGASTARPTGARRASTSRARSSRCCPRRSPTRPARSCPHQDRLAVTVRARARGRRGRAHRLPPLADPLRRAPGLPPASTGSSPAPSAREEPWAAPLAARARRRRRARRARGPRAARSRSSRSSRSSTSPHEGHVTGARADRADRVAPADRAPDDRRQRGRGGAARDAQAAGALPRARAARARSASSTSSSSSRRSTCPRRRCPSTMSPQQAGELVGEVSRLVDEHVRRTGPRPRRR